MSYRDFFRAVPENDNLSLHEVQKDVTPDERKSFAEAAEMDEVE